MFGATLFVLLIPLMIILSIVRPYSSLFIDYAKSSSNNEPQLVPPTVANFDTFVASSNSANSPSSSAYSSLGSYDDNDFIRRFIFYMFIILLKHWTFLRSKMMCNYLIKNYILYTNIKLILIKKGILYLFDYFWLLFFLHEHKF